MADPSNPGNQSEPACSFFRKPSKNKNIRKRTVDEDEDADENSKTQFPLIHNKEKPPQPDNKLKFSAHSQRSMSESSLGSSALMFQFESSKEIQVQDDSRATTTLETKTECSKDAHEMRERVLKQAKQGLKGKRTSPVVEKLYKGLHGYTDFRAGFRREQTVCTEKAGGAHGPLRASAHIRVSARFDYQPDICKDYKETGYCGYGDACKFIHDRGD